MSLNDPQTHHQLNEVAKGVGDVVSAGIAVGALVELLPAVAAVTTIIWTAIRIYETSTIQKLLRKVPK